MNVHIYLTRRLDMKVIAILQILLGVAGIFLGSMMFGDIGLACIVGALAALLS